MVSVVFFCIMEERYNSISKEHDCENINVSRVTMSRDILHHQHHQFADPLTFCQHYEQKVKKSAVKERRIEKNEFSCDGRIRLKKNEEFSFMLLIRREKVSDFENMPRCRWCCCVCLFFIMDPCTTIR
jgi:hypothetical protein